jgi:BA14K-like protein
MSRSIAKLMVAAIVAVPLYANVSSAAPISATALTNAAPSNVEQIRWAGGWGGGRGWGWRGGGWGGRGWGWGAGGFAAGAIIGGAIASAPYYYGGGPYYGGYYAAPGYYAESGDGGDDGVAYCMQRYRTYDPNSGTFMGNDGRRHPCP